MKLLVTSSGNFAINTEYMEYICIEEISEGRYVIIIDSTRVAEFDDFNECKREFNRILDFLSDIGGIYKAEGKK